ANSRFTNAYGSPCKPTRSTSTTRFTLMRRQPISTPRISACSVPWRTRRANFSFPLESPSNMTRTLILLAAARFLSAQSLPTDWIDPDTGHRIIRLSTEDGTQSLYFNQNAYTADGKRLIVTTPGGGIATITLATREVKPLVPGPVSVLVAGHKSGDVYYTRREGAPGGGRGFGGPATVYATNVNTGATRKVVDLPAGRGVSSLNADETLLLGTYI